MLAATSTADMVALTDMTDMAAMTTMADMTTMTAMTAMADMTRGNVATGSMGTIDPGVSTIDTTGLPLLSNEQQLLPTYHSHSHSHSHSYSQQPQSQPQSQSQSRPDLLPDVFTQQAQRCHSLPASSYPSGILASATPSLAQVSNPTTFPTTEFAVPAPITSAGPCPLSPSVRLFGRAFPGPQSSTSQLEASEVIAQAAAHAAEPLLNANQTSLPADAAAILGMSRSAGGLDSILTLDEEASIQEMVEVFEGSQHALEAAMTSAAASEYMSYQASTHPSNHVSNHAQEIEGPSATNLSAARLHSSQSNTMQSHLSNIVTRRQRLLATMPRRSSRQRPGQPVLKPYSPHTLAYKLPPKLASKIASKRQRLPQPNPMPPAIHPRPPRPATRQRGGKRPQRIKQEMEDTSDEEPAAQGRHSRKRSKAGVSARTGVSKYPRECPNPGCGKVFSSSAGFYYHVRTVHNQDKNPALLCPIPHCAKAFRSVPGLEYHLKKHQAGEIVDGNKRVLRCDDVKAAKALAMQRRRGGSLKADEATTLAKRT